MTAALDYAGMPLQYVEARAGKRGRPVTIDRIRRMEAIVDEVGRRPIAITARHLFYRLTSATEYRDAVIPKTDKAYHRVLADLLELRRSGDVPWSAITDGTRTKTRWVGYGDLAEAAEQWKASYRRDIWRSNWATCEVWTESRGLLATINAVAGEYGVTTLGVGGFNSASVGYETSLDVEASAARVMGATIGQHFYIFHHGDLDPSGQAIGDTAERDIRYHLHPAHQDLFHFQRVALTPAQVAQYDLPSAPVKRNDDGSIRGGHAKAWEGGAVELDALDPTILQALVRESIESIIDHRALNATHVAEESERLIIDSMIKAMRP